MHIDYVKYLDMVHFDIDNVVKMLSSIIDDCLKFSPVTVTILCMMRMGKQALNHIVNPLEIMVYGAVVMMEIALFLSFCRHCMCSDCG